MEVALDYGRGFRVKIFHITRKEDATTLGSSFRLRNKRLPTPPFFHFTANCSRKLLPKIPIFSRQEPSLREKFVIVREELLHPGQVSCQIVFSRQSVHTWKVIDALVWFHPIEFLALHRAVGPEDVPFVVGVFWVTGEICPTQPHFV